MKVLFDYQVFNMQKFGGISRYFLQIMESFYNDESLKMELPIRYTDNYYIRHSEIFKDITEDSKDIKSEQLFFGLDFRGKARVHNFVRKYTFNSARYNQNLTIEALKKGDFDIFHPTYYDPYFLNYIGDRPFVLFVPDLIQEKYGEFYMGKNGWDIILWKKETITRASRLHVISEAVKEDLIDIYNIDADKIDVVYLSSSVGNDTSKKTLDVNQKYILYVGNRADYKNFYTFIQAFRQLKEKFPDINLICTGGGNFPKDDYTLFEKLGIRDSVHYLPADHDHNLAYLYQNAEAFIYPSYAEGFGIPLCEAFENNCPVVASNIAPFKEIGDDAIVYFDPKNISDMVKKISSVVNNKAKKDELIQKGKERVKLFTAEKTVKATRASYNKILV